METETKRNIELMWLAKKIYPDHGTLSAFMKNNKGGLCSNGTETYNLVTYIYI